MLRPWLSVALATLLATSAGAQDLSGYSGFIRDEYVTYSTYPLELPVDQGKLKGRSTDSESTVQEVRFANGKATGSIRSRSASEGYSHLHLPEFVCLDRTRSDYTRFRGEQKLSRGSASGPAVCKASVEEKGVGMHCDVRLDDKETEVVTRHGGQQSSCEEWPSGSSGYTDTTHKPMEGFSSGFWMELPEGPLPSVLSGSQREDREPGTRTLSWMLVREGEYELVLEPEPDYATSWRPKAGATERERGNTLVIKATLKRKDGKALDLYAEEILFRLAQRSHEPGVMMNHPAPSAQSSPALPDLMFEPELNEPLDLEVRGTNGAEAVTRAGASYETVYVYVSSFDWGAHGTLTAEARLPSGERVAGRLAQSPGSYELHIPRRPSGDDPIAAGWRTAGEGRAGDALSDADGKPTGDGYPGDGLSLYEEYRGFSVNGKRVEGDPVRKELFLRNKVGGRALEGIANFAQRSGMRVHPELSDAEMDEGRVVNFNSTGQFQRVRQHAVILEMSAVRTDAIAVGGPGTPKSIQAIEFPLDLIIVSSFPKGYFTSTVGHELGHAVNIYHHGDTDPGKKRYRVVEGVVYESDASDESLTPDGKKAVTLLHEDGRPFDLAKVHVRKVPDVGVRQGQHSGQEHCMMRYDVARFHVRDDPAVLYFNSPPEVVGTTLCTRPEGSGVNTAGRLPAPRYGDAAKNRGTCAAQLCVNDAHGHSER